MGRGRRSGEQRNQATSGHKLKKKRRSRTGKGINSREFVGSWIHVAGAQTRRWRPASGGGGSSPVAGGRRPASRVTVSQGGDAAWGVGVSECGRRGQRDKGCLTGLGRIHNADTYQPTYPIFVKIIKIRILRRCVSLAYQTRIRIRIRYVSDTQYAAS